MAEGLAPFRHQAVDIASVADTSVAEVLIRLRLRPVLAVRTRTAVLAIGAGTEVSISDVEDPSGDKVDPSVVGTKVLVSVGSFNDNKEKTTDTFAGSPKCRFYSYPFLV